ncbi:MAG TPA: hypothetical protein VJO34_01560 [Methylomirabilota bacterium]|nr:hypothetical protein [Methylomirabilota bacterium]
MREHLLTDLEFTGVSEEVVLRGQFPKVGAPVHERILQKVFAGKGFEVERSLSPHRTGQFIFYQESTGYWVKATVGLPYYAKNGETGAPPHGRYLFFSDSGTAHIVSAVLNSSLFYTYFIAYSDGFHLSDRLATGFRLAPSILGDRILVKLDGALLADLKGCASVKTINTKLGDQISYAEFNVSESKQMIDNIDSVLARHYGFTEEELDFIINYDIKYRMGRDAEGEDED